MAANIITDQISDAQLERYAKVVYEATGNRVSPQKKTLLSNRIRRRLRATGVDDYEAYLKRLSSLPRTDPEWDAFLQEVTTHETWLFRDEAQWTWFGKEFLADMQARAKAGKRRKSLRIWSAACSTGAEAFTVAICIAEHLPAYRDWNIQILGTDIGAGAVEEAKLGVFGERAMRQVQGGLRKKFFAQVDDRAWRVNSDLQKMTQFRRHNLLKPLRQPPMDLVILKNVLIYFDADSKQVAIRNIEQSMHPGSLLLCGAAEGVSDCMDGFDRLQSWLFAKK